MSENLLAKVTEWPWFTSDAYSYHYVIVDSDGFPIGEFPDEPILENWPEKYPELKHWARGKDKTVRNRSAEVEANRDLFKLAPDHALLLAACASDLAECGTDGVRAYVEIYTRTGDDGRWGPAVPVEKDPFGCPILTPELRTALRAAIGLEKR